MFWALFGVMALVALFALAWPLYRTEQRVSGRSIGIAVVVAAGSVALYQQIGQPDARLATAGAAGPGDIEEMVASLSSRLESNPNDIAGWKLLGRSYSVMRRYPEAIAAYERAVELESSSNGQTLVDLGEAVFMNDSQSLAGRAGQLFESSIAVTPDNPKSLFYSGLSAAERGDQVLAAERWEALLATSPPPEIESVLTQRIAEWRGVAPEAVQPAAAESASASLLISMSLAPSAQAAVDPAATVFLIARDPAQPSPPIAAVRRKAGELPIEITLTDSDAMIPGRLISGFRQLEIVARVSASGQPTAQTGDWFGSAQMDTAETRNLGIVIDQQVP